VISQPYSCTSNDQANNYDQNEKKGVKTVQDGDRRPSYALGMNAHFRQVFCDNGCECCIADIGKHEPVEYEGRTK